MHGVTQIASPNCDARPPGVEATSSSCTESACRPANRRTVIDRLFTNDLPADAHPPSGRGGAAGVAHW